MGVNVREDWSRDGRRIILIVCNKHIKSSISWGFCRELLETIAFQDGLSESEEEECLLVPVQVALCIHMVAIDSTTLQKSSSGLRQPGLQTAEVTLAA